MEEHRPPLGWPNDCQIEFDNLFVKYSESLDFVLKGLSCKILGKEKIGMR